MAGTQLNHIQVCCRIRGSDDGQPSTISTFLNNDAADSRGARSYEVVTLNGSFQMDYAFDNGDSQECIFDRIVQPLLADAFAGFNCSLFSYGQTGSGKLHHPHHTVSISALRTFPMSFYPPLAGKTYTLIGNTGNALASTITQDNRERGIIPRAAEQIFAKQASLDPQKVMCQVRMSILEVYQEQLKDLLRVSTVNGPSVSAKDTNGLRIREQIDGTVWVEGLTELAVTEDGDFNRLLSGALKRRVVGAHSMNDVSSRSHFCCILNINQVFHATGVKINSKVHFIDLAGSEMVRFYSVLGLFPSIAVR
jgi:kinesin family protein 11